MSTLHERLLAEPDIWTREAQSDPTGAVDRLAAAVRAVVELHAPVQCRCAESVHTICAGGEGHTDADRCKTIRAIADALGVETGETPK